MESKEWEKVEWVEKKEKEGREIIYEILYFIDHISNMLCRLDHMGKISVCWKFKKTKKAAAEERERKRGEQRWLSKVIILHCSFFKWSDAKACVHYCINHLLSLSLILYLENKRSKDWIRLGD